MRICFVIDSMGAGGKERQLFYLLKYLSVKPTYSIQLIILSEDIFYLSPHKLNIDLVLIKKDSRYSFKSLRRIFNRLNAFRPTIVHFWCEVGPLLCTPYFLLHKEVKFIHSIRYGGVVKRNILGKITNIYNLKCSDMIISNSWSGIEVNALTNSSKIRVIYNGIEPNNEILKGEGEADTSLPYINCTYKVVMVASFTEAKDQITLVKATNKLVDSGFNLGVIFVGEGPLLERVRSSVSEQNKNHYFFLGKKDDVHNILSQMNFGILLSNTNGHAEGLSNAIMEYMMQGLPVIATRAGGTLELVQDGINGYLVEDGDVEMLLEKIKYLISNPDVAIQMGRTNSEKISEEFTTKKMIQLYEEVYNELMQVN